VQVNYNNDFEDLPEGGFRMKLSILLIINAVIALIFGIVFVLVPGPAVIAYGVTPEPALNYIAQLFGGALITIAILTWLVRNAAASEALQAIIVALLVGNAIGFVVALIAQLVGVVNALGWATVVIYLLLTLGYAYFEFARPSMVRPATSS
jgi:hypothetical protein